MSGGSYSQNFDSLNSSGTSLLWANNLTLPGWYASRGVAPTDVVEYDAGAGSSIKGALYSFGPGGSTERALGSVASDAQGNIAYGIRFVNDTSFDRTNFVVSYSGEQWRVANAAVQALVFSYRIGLSLTNADARNTQNWTPFPALNFNSPNTNA